MIKHKIREDNLQRLIDERFGGVAGRLAEKLQMNPSYIYRIFTDNPEHKRNLGETLAEKIEIGCGLEPGWLDREHAPEENVSPAPALRGMVPLVSWVQAGAWCGIADPYAPGGGEKWMPCHVAHNSNTYALTVRGISMEPDFREGDVIYVDPGKAAEHKSFVVVRLDDSQEATFKQLIMEGGKRYLRPLNPAWPEQVIEFKTPATLCGVVIGKWTSYP